MTDLTSAFTINRRAFLTATAAAALYPRAAMAAPPNAEVIRQTVGAPAAGVGFQRAGEVTLSVAGKRAVGYDADVEEDDLWHLGSLTKSMTAVLAARLVEQGIISWDDQIGARLDTVSPDLQAVTLEQLLHHRGGIDANPPMDFVISQKIPDESDLITTRLRYLSEALTSTVAAQGQFHYSNTGYVAAAAMMEVATGEPWEALIAREVFAPLGVTSAGFGPPGQSASAPDQPWGHHKDPFAVTHPPTFDADNPVALNPAGRVHMSLGDFLTYLTAHARRDPILNANSWKRQHKPASGADVSYAMGLAAPTEAVRMHSGSNTIWFATGGFNDRGDAIAMVTNIGTGANLPAPMEALVSEFLNYA